VSTRHWTRVAAYPWVLFATLRAGVDIAIWAGISQYRLAPCGLLSQESTQYLWVVSSDRRLIHRNGVISMAAVLSGISLDPIGEMYQFMGYGYLDSERQQLRIYKDEMSVAWIELIALQALGCILG
jgi:hypothetical protein